jgi:hypothetical protein
LPKEATPAKTETKQKRLSLERRRQLYAARQFLPRDAQKELGLHLRLPVYFKDPKVAADLPDFGIDATFEAPWEPGLADRPTSARFAVVDWDETSGRLTPPARWSARRMPSSIPRARSSMRRRRIRRSSGRSAHGPGYRTRWSISRAGQIWAGASRGGSRATG